MCNYLFYNLINIDVDEMLEKIAEFIKSSQELSELRFIDI